MLAPLNCVVTTSDSFTAVNIKLTMLKILPASVKPFLGCRRQSFGVYHVWNITFVLRCLLFQEIILRPEKLCDLETVRPLSSTQAQQGCYLRA